MTIYDGSAVDRLDRIEKLLEELFRLQKDLIERTSPEPRETALAKFDRLTGYNPTESVIG